VPRELCRCCDAAASFDAFDCVGDPTLMTTLASVGISPAGLNATLSVLLLACDK
jgi:hypothetical protein